MDKKVAGQDAQRPRSDYGRRYGSQQGLFVKNFTSAAHRWPKRPRGAAAFERAIVAPLSRERYDEGSAMPGEGPSEPRRRPHIKRPPASITPKASQPTPPKKFASLIHLPPAIHQSPTYIWNSTEADRYELGTLWWSTPRW